ncbi:MAG: helix-turn-helix transcriptional regulator [Prevotellaceae bacterium]|jgi:transcriptional regulator with XRE-family HTH domain|nr:helix-turn-helix transcriptional regulator [Prevotellaceae bacterium]
MNYHKIKIELERRKITIKAFCQQVGTTEQSLHQMIRNRSMKVDMLERISLALKLPVGYWFDDGALSAGSEATSAQKKTPQAVGTAERIDAVTSELNSLLKELHKK